MHTKFYIPLLENNPHNKNGKFTWERLFFTFWAFYFTVFWGHSISIDEQGNMLAGHVNLWGDWATHFTMGSAMAYRDLIPDTSPLLLDAKFSYPFATNLISALLVKLDVPFFYAFVIPSFIFSLLLVAAVYIFFRVLLKHRYITLLASCIFLFNGGVGFYYYMLDVLHASQTLSTLLNPLHEYTHLEPEHIKWISVISSMVIPQRAFTMGFGVTLAALTLILHSFQLLQETNRPPKIGLNIIASVLLGFLPIIHTHSFLASFVILSCWLFADLVRTPVLALKQRIMHWLVIIGLSSLIALPILNQFFFGHIDSHFFKWYPGWYAKEFNINWFSFWFRNWTLVPFLAFFALVFLVIQQGSARKKWQILLVFLPGFILFIVPNLILTQPWIWDNTKLIIWSSIFFSGLAAYSIYLLFHENGLISIFITRILLYLKSLFSPTETAYTTQLESTLYDVKQNLSIVHSQMLHRDSTTNQISMHTILDQISNTIDSITTQMHVSATKQPFYNTVKLIRITLLALTIGCILSAGILDVYYTARVDLHTFTMYTQEELELAEWVKKETPIDAKWLVSNKHNHWLFNLTGRQAIITYTGWLWSHGYNYYPIEQDMMKIYRTANKDLIKQYGIQYVIIDSQARKEMGANDALFRDSFPVIKETKNYVIFTTANMHYTHHD